MCWKRIKGLFTRKKEEAVPPARPLRRRREFPFRFIKTSRGGLNMPKYQRCPSCSADAKRESKTDTGATYICRCKTAFVITHPGLRKVNAPKVS